MQPIEQLIRYYNDADFETLNCIAEYWLVFGLGNIDVAYLKWDEMFLNLACPYIPNKAVKIKIDDKPWFNSELGNLLRQKNKAYHGVKSSTRSGDWAHFRRERNHYTEKIRKAAAVRSKEPPKNHQRTTEDAINTLLYTQLTILTKRHPRMCDPSSLITHIYKLDNYDVHPSLKLWILNFFTNRTQCVKTSKENSEKISINTGGYQGCVLSTFLFIVYTNDMRSPSQKNHIIKYGVTL